MSKRIVASWPLGAAVALLLVGLFLWTPQDGPEGLPVGASSEESEGLVPASPAAESPVAPEADGTALGLPAGNSRASGGVVGGPVVVGFEAIAETLPRRERDEHEHRIREWEGRFVPAMDAGLLGRQSSGELELRLPNGDRIEIMITRRKELNASTGAFVGKVGGAPLSRFIVSYAGDALAGTIDYGEGGALWEIRNAGGGRQALALVDASALGECQACVRLKGVQ